MPTRPRNPSGFVRKHPDTQTTRWQGIVKYPDPDKPGKWKQRSAAFARKAEAQQWVDSTLAEHRSTPNYHPPSDVTVGKYMIRWLEGISSRVRPSTLRSYRQMAQHVIHALGDRPLVSLTPMDLQSLYGRLGETLSPRTVSYVHAVTRHALQDAEDWNIIPTNPVRKAKPPRGAPKELKIPTPIEAQQWLRAVEGDRLYALWAWLTLTGTRRGEALGLMWQDIDWDKSTVSIRRALTGVGKAKVLGPVKTTQGVRSLAISSHLVNILRTHANQQDMDRLAQDSTWPNTGLVFTTRKGAALDPRYVLRRFKQLLAKAGLPTTYRIHDLRHGMASYWLANGVPVKVVSERLGHANVAFTLQVYGHVLPNQQAVAAQTMDEELLGFGVTTASPRASRNSNNTQTG